MEEKEIDLREIIGILLKRKWTVIVIFLVACVSSIIYSLVLPKIYESTVTLIILPPRFKPEFTLPTFSVETYRDLLKSKGILKRVEESLNLKEKITVFSLERMLTVKVVEQKAGAKGEIKYAPLIELKAKGNSPALAKSLVEKWTEIFLEQHKELSCREKDLSQLYISSQYDETKQKLFVIEEKIKNFEIKWKISILKRELEIKENRFVGGKKRLQEIEKEFAMKKVELTSSEEEFKKQKLTLVLSKAITDDALWEEKLKGGEEREIENLSLKSEQINPLYLKLREKITNLKIKIKSLENEKGYTEKEIKKLKGEIDYLKNLIYEKSLLLERMQREKNALKETYSLFLQKMESTRISKVEQITDIKIISEAVLPERRIKPNRRQIVMISGIIGIIFGTFIAFLKEFIVSADTV